MIERKLNYRPTYDYTNEEPIAGNYYPVTSRIMIRDKNDLRDFGVINDRSQGGSSLDEGKVELMVIIFKCDQQLLCLKISTRFTGD